MSCQLNDSNGKSPFEKDNDVPSPSGTARKGCCPSGCWLAALICTLITFTVLLGVFALLIPAAINAHREAQRREECLKNLKELGEALQNFHEANQEFPNMPPIEEIENDFKNIEKYMDLPEDNKDLRVPASPRENNDIEETP